MLRSVVFQLYTVEGNNHVRVNPIHTMNVDVPDTCPLCNFGITPLVLSCYAIGKDNGQNPNEFIAVLFCPHCRKPFVASYTSSSSLPQSVAPKSIPSMTFDQKIADLSPGFVKIYNQAFAAESLGMDEVPGMGYRKALEFLIKDYLIYRAPDQEDAIKREALGSCISNRVDNPRLKTTASRAVWLGNDFTHYDRKYEEYEITHLKQFIDATVHWILMELTADEAESMDRR